MRLPNTLSLVALALVATPVHAEDSPLRIVTDGNRPIAIEALGWTSDELAKFAKPDANTTDYLQKTLRIFVLGANGQPQLPAIGGAYSVVENAVRFTPQYALRPGMNYQADYFPPARRPTDSPAHHTLDIKLPAPPPAPLSHVTAIYPSGNVLPENQLRFYVHFSGPMAAGDAYAHVKLLKANGEEVKRAFLEIGEELWDPSFQRLTLLFDPGRVKKGLSPRAMFGPVLEEGKSYRLVVEKSWRDANGQPLTANFEKQFQAGPPTETAVDHKQWKITPPPAGTRQPLVIHFPRQLDRALLNRMITVADASGKQIGGDITFANAERQWQFQPDENWPSGALTLVVDTALEDTAGNNLARPFEVDVFDRVDDRAGPEFVRIPFSTVSPAEKR